MKPTDEFEDVSLYCGDAMAVLPSLDSESVDAVITDPPYPEIDRDYGRMSEREWHEMMDVVVPECRRVLKPTGSAVFILQPNSERVGRMRTWLWEFMAKWGREWGQVQDAWWWNIAAMPSIHTQRTVGLLRPSLKSCVWLGDDSCYRNQDEILWSESEANKAADRGCRALKYQPSGQHIRTGRISGACDERGGVTPFNVIPLANTDSTCSAGANGHGAGTPFDLCSWWVRYICPPGGTVLDPFVGSGTVGLAAKGRPFIGIEKHEKHYATALRRLRHASGRSPDQLFAVLEE